MMSLTTNVQLQIAIEINKKNLEHINNLEYIAKEYAEYQYFIEKQDHELDAKATAYAMNNNESKTLQI